MSRWLALASVISVGCGFQVQLGGDSGAGGDDGGGTVDGAIDQAPTPWLTGWMYRRAITLHASEIEAPGDGALTGIPVMNAAVDRSDLAFTASDATTRLAHELEAFDSTSATVWVKIPSLPATTDTTIFLYYGNAMPVPLAESVWTESFRAVYHLQQDPGPGGAGEIRDASPNGHHATAEQSFQSADSVATPFGRGMEFNGSNSCVTVPALDVGAQFTVSAWMNLDNVSQIRTLVSNSQDGSNTNGFRFFVNSNGSSDRKVWLETGNGGQTNSVTTASNAITTDAWHHVTVLVDRASGTATVLVDGAIAGTDGTIRNDFSTTLSLEIGRMKTNNVFDGTLDEVVIASTVRSVEWIQTTYKNQRAPNTFATIGSQEAHP